MKKIIPIIGLTVSVSLLVLCKEKRPIPELEKFVVKNVIHPSNNPFNQDKVELGKTLYFDPRLSFQQNASCAGCHNSGSVADGFPRNKIHNSAPSLTNVALYKDVFKDPEAKELEDIVKEKVHSQSMLRDEAGIIRRLSSIAEYRELFTRAFGTPEVTMERIALSLSAFQRTIVSKNSKFDRFVMGEEEALTPAQIRGWEVFQNKAKCVQCHEGPNFSDSQLHTTGLPGIQGKVRTPTLRDVTRKKSFMHNGKFGSIEDTVNHFAEGGHARAIQDPLLKPAGLSEQDKKDLIEFLKALEGEPIQWEMPSIPKA
ncbi:cytochrome-c peroxidase [Leptospira wolffii]|uniref:Methylamine utilization protein MauG n=1 Tax=Leptospira wolffii TaxID=409998 RepID=A0A2M9ZA54_9LEPT|nr:cytochrome c peroxidase [Leptospira wolffii]PJZ65326.1 cytochrome-c peroxidase [Leptospira wolffii]TGK64795.1 cytochrome-c peroxidase [Leptospira wolffii]TGK76806.1 cytochrome-c peroxidase [Leptospira wolffii]TGK77342.1 cytochrome-c peroxidase [Leptospira wolffii]TGL26737.1 cytochrome-c peroxidase [Leptospira wolffii]